ncbi:hypothetical protein [Propionivibrio sp.]|uniref:hypothetical protein n=1 Tax=Propionivibrio sp. TaxID=2212460 RepID=UPI003BF221E3
MRSYPVDSKDSMARVVVMALMAEGAIDPSELKLLERPEIIARMGFDHACLTKVTQEFCQDLEISAANFRSSDLGLDPQTIDLLLAEIRSPALQANLLRAMLDIVYADGHITGGEAVVIAQAMKRWGLDLYEERDEPQERRWVFSARRDAKAPFK